MDNDQQPHMPSGNQEGDVPAQSQQPAMQQPMVQSEPSAPMVDQSPPAQPTPQPMASQMPSPAPSEGAPAAVSKPVVTTGGVRQPNKKLLLGVGAVAVVVLAAAGYVFGYYLPNTPSNVYSASLRNSGKALDTLIAYSQKQESANYKSMSFDGSLKATTGGGSYEFSLTGSADANANMTMHADADILGEKPSFAIRSVHVKGNDSPDIYVQVSNIKSFLDSYNLNQFDNLDGQWIAIDHTLVDSYKTDLKNWTTATANAGANTANSVPTFAQLHDAMAKAQLVDRQYIFTADPNTAVLKNEQFIGKETLSGRSADHYRIGYDKAHLQSYVTALGQALDSSQLNDWSKNANGGKSISDVMDFASLKQHLANAKSDYTFDLWADTKTKLVSKIVFTDPNDATSLFTLTQGYTGGSKYPFTYAMSGKDSSGQPESGTLGMTVDTATNKINGTLSATTNGSDATTVTGTFDVTPSNSAVSVAAPPNAKSVVDVLGELGLGNLANNPSSLSDFSSI